MVSDAEGATPASHTTLQPRSFVSERRVRRISDIFVMPSAGRGRALDGLRGIAVILTYFVHAASFFLLIYRDGNPNNIALMQWPTWETRILSWLFYSHHGVYIFFILSGFLITKMVFRNARFDYVAFLGKRLLRIYPAFLLALAVTLAIMHFLWHAPLDGMAVLGNLFFLNALPGLGITGYITNTVTWSLFYEFAFYFSFPFIALVAKGPTTRVLAIIVYGLIASQLPKWFGSVPSRFHIFYRRSA